MNRMEPWDKQSRGVDDEKEQGEEVEEEKDMKEEDMKEEEEEKEEHLYHCLGQSCILCHRSNGCLLYTSPSPRDS